MLTAELDSLTAVMSTHEALADENRTLRGLLDLRERAGPEYASATVTRPGTPGSEGVFHVDVGSDDGIEIGAPVVSVAGLVGVIREVRPGRSVGMDWSNPDFRASAMSADGSTYGMVENQKGRFTEEDRLILNGVAYNQAVLDDGIVVTSGLGGYFPRGIPIGRIDGLADAEGEWRKSYFLRPMVHPGSALHVLVLRVSAAETDVSEVWAVPDSVTPDSLRVNGAGS